MYQNAIATKMAQQAMKAVAPDSYQHTHSV